MIDSETLEKLQKASIQDRIAVIEMLLQSLKSDIPPNPTSVSSSTLYLKRRAVLDRAKSRKAPLSDPVEILHQVREERDQQIDNALLG